MTDPHVNRRSEAFVVALVWVAASMSWMAPDAAAQKRQAGDAPSAHVEGAEIPERCVRLSADDCPLFHVTQLELVGLSWTKPYVVERELVFSEGDVASYAEIRESVQRVRNTHIFRKVDFRLDVSTGEVDTEIRRANLRIELDERWTLRPIIQYTRAGGTQRLILGAGDINLLGRYLGIGARYERLGPTNSFYFWAYDPRFFGERLRVGVNVGTFNRLFTLYDDGDDVEGGFLMRRFEVGAYVRREWYWWLETYLGVSYLSDRNSLDFVSETASDLQRDRGGAPPDGHLLMLEIGGSIGRIDEDNYLRDGQIFGVGFDLAESALGSSHDLYSVDVSGKFMRTLPLKSTVALRAATGFAHAELIQHRYFLGGLDSVRGLRHDALRGRQYWLAGAEFRVPSFDYRWFVLHHVGFIDLAHVSDDPSGYFGLSGASVGIGVRIIVPKIEGFIARVDWAFPLYGAAPNPLNLGGGQFF